MTYQDEKTFGVCLARVRCMRGLSQIRLAELADADHSYVSRLERGNRHPSRSIVDRFIWALALPAGEADVLLAAAGFIPDQLRETILRDGWEDAA